MESYTLAQGLTGYNGFDWFFNNKVEIVTCNSVFIAAGGSIGCGIICMWADVYFTGFRWTFVEYWQRVLD